MKRIVIALLAGAGLLVAGCSSDNSTPACTTDADCGTGKSCQNGACVAKPAATCDPACADPTPVCDKSNFTCVQCLDNGSCPDSGKPVCNAATKTCVQCTDNANCPTSGTPVCDLTQNLCVVCTAAAGCPAEQMCDTAVAGGVCKPRPDCLTSDDCQDGLVCDTTLGKCVTCTEDEGCTGGKVCDTSVNGGACVECLDNTQCAASGKVCDAAAKKCVTCTAAAGCTNQVCDTSVDGGACVDCLDDSRCTAGGKVCDPSAKACVTCLTGSNHGCDQSGAAGALKYCDVDASAGARCVACLSDGHCGGNKVCNAEKACVTCVTDGDRGCRPGQTCVTTGNPDGLCEGCEQNSNCGTNQVCDSTQGNGNGLCVACTAGDGCLAPKVCDGAGTPTASCVECSANVTCPSTKPVCDSRVCYVCTASTGCSGATPKCLTTAAAGLGECVQCLTNGDCAEPTPVCSLSSHTCELGTGPAATSQQIQTVRTTADGSGLSLPIQGAMVTYLKPLLQTTTPEPAGFFVQAEQNGPAIFVAVDPTTTTPPAEVGDKVSFTVTAVTTATGLKQVTAITGYGRVSTDNAVTSLVQDLSGASDVLSAAGTYESELVKLTGAIVGSFASAGAGHSSAQLKTAGMIAEPNMKLRIPQTLATNLELVDTCALTVTGPMWRYVPATGTAQVQPSAYEAADLTGISCPLPKLTTAAAASPTSLTLTFSRKIDPATVQTDGSQFALTGGLAVSNAAVSNNTVTLTTAAQAPGSSYTVTVPNSVKDSVGGSVDPASNSATFTGYALKVVGAVASSATEVKVTFDRAVKDTSVATGAFSFTNGLTASNALASGTTVTVTTSAQTSGTAYTVTVAATVTDAAGVPVGIADNTADFTGYSAAAVCTPQVVISQVYGGGGNSGATLRNDFIELHNRGTTAADLTGWSVQYASATGSFGTANITNLTGSIPAGGYYLIQEAAGSGGSQSLPTPEVTGTIAMSGTAFKVALVSNQTPLSGYCPTGSSIVDFVGVGSAGNNSCFEGSASVPAIANATAALRKGDGCTDTGNNSSDFEVATPSPRNGATAALMCACP